MSLIRKKTPDIREKTIDTINAYYSATNPYNGEVIQRTRTFSQETESEVIEAIRAVSNVEKSIVIIHGGIGCSYIGNSLSEKNNNLIWYSTNLNERDTIIGGEDKLREAILTGFNKYKPEIIFIISTPIVAINNDDINGVISEVVDEIDAKIVPIFSTGFKSRSKYYGHDLSFHAIVKTISNSKGISEYEKKTINLVAIDESIENIIEIVKIITDYGAKVNLLGSNSSIENIKNAYSAVGTIVINEERGRYLASIIEEIYNVPYIKLNPPIGIKETVGFIENIKELLNYNIEVNDYEWNEKKHNRDIKLLQGKNVYLDVSAYILKGIADLVVELGGHIVGVSVDSISSLNSEVIEFVQGDLKQKIHVSNNQEFEKVNILKKSQADLLISDKDLGRIAELVDVKIASIRNLYTFGFDGAKNIEEILKVTINNKGFINGLELNEEVYKKAYLDKSAGWYIKQEVN